MRFLLCVMLFAASGCIENANATSNGGSGAANGETVTGAIATTSTITVGTYTRHFTVNAGSVTQGPNAPTMVSIASTYRGLGVNANNETLFFTWHVPAPWDTISDIDIIIHWTNEPGTAIGDGETVIWDCDWQAKGDGEDLDSSASTNATTTYTQSGAGTDGELQETTIVIDYDDATNPLALGDIVGFECFRDATADTYGTSEDVVFLLFGIEYNATTFGPD